MAAEVATRIRPTKTVVRTTCPRDCYDACGIAVINNTARIAAGTLITRRAAALTFVPFSDTDAAATAIASGHPVEESSCSSNTPNRA